jgi:hypothetical protein
LAIDADEEVGRFDTLHPLLKQFFDGRACFDFNVVGEAAAKVVDEKDAHDGVVLLGS